jgi:hypothetical protein
MNKAYANRIQGLLRSLSAAIADVSSLEDMELNIWVVSVLAAEDVRVCLLFSAALITSSLPV